MDSYRVDIIRDGKRTSTFGEADDTLEAIQLITTGLESGDHLEVLVKGNPHGYQASLTGDPYELVGYGTSDDSELSWVEVVDGNHIDRKPIGVLFLS